MTDSRFHNNAGPFSIADIARVGACEIIAPDIKISDIAHDIATLELARPCDISFLTNRKYLAQLGKTKALACIISRDFTGDAPKNLWLLVSDNPHRSYAQISQAFYPETRAARASGNISASAKIGKNCEFGHNVVIEDNVEIGDDSYIDHNTVIKAGVVIGKRAKIGANVTISHAIIGDDILILPGVSIGQDGFGFATDKGKHYKIPQVGRVIIGSDVEIGAGTTIDRGAIADTIIADMCRLDNLVQIGHNAQIGKGSIIVAQVGISGSTKIGNYCVIGGQVGIAGHLNIGNYVQAAGQSGITKDLEDKAVVGGTPAVPLADYHRQAIYLKKATRKTEKT